MVIEDCPQKSNMEFGMSVASVISRSLHSQEGHLIFKFSLCDFV